MDKQIALQNLKDIGKVLGRRHWWLEAGSCLGAYREGDFIGHDKDTDIGLLKEDFDWALIAQLVHEYNFRILHVFGAINHGLEISVAREGIKTDIFIFYKKGTKRWHAAWTRGCHDINKDIIKLVFDADLIENLGTAKLGGVDFPVPAETERYLVARYGKDWRTPDEKWNWATSPLCIDPDFDISL